MVELPSGKMKSREGTVVDADDLMEEMVEISRRMSAELGKLEYLSEEEAEDTYRMIALGALKYFILKVDPKKNMLLIRKNPLISMAIPARLFSIPMHVFVLFFVKQQKKIRH